jgi:hypothetical protein
MAKFLVLGLIFFSTVSFAGDSGCGLGSMIIQKNSKLLQLFSMTTNGFFFTQPLGITSGTSGCSANGLVSNDKELEYFVEINNDDLSREMARGEGEKLQVLAQMNGCRDPQAQRVFSQMTKASFATIYPTADEKAEQVLARIKAQMKSNSDVQRMCQVAAL